MRYRPESIWKASTVLSFFRPWGGSVPWPSRATSFQMWVNSSRLRRRILVRSVDAEGRSETWSGRPLGKAMSLGKGAQQFGLAAFEFLLRDAQPPLDLRRILPQEIHQGLVRYGNESSTGPSSSSDEDDLMFSDTIQQAVRLRLELSSA